MVPLSLSSSVSAYRAFSLYNNNNKAFLSLEAPRHHHHHPKLFFDVVQSSTSLITYNPLRVSVSNNGMVMKKKRGFGAVCYAHSPLTARNLQFIATVASTVLMFAKGTAVQKSFLVPLFALQAPSSIVAWIKGEYGIWAAFLALLVRLFFFIPGELELPFLATLLVIVAPSQVMHLRGTQEGAIIALVIAAYLAFQHFSRAGSLQKTFEQGSIIATVATVCITAVSCLLLI